MAGGANPQMTQPAGNVFQQSAGALTGAMAGTRAGMGYQPQQVQTQWGYNPATMRSQNVQTQWGYKPATASADKVGTDWGYDAERVGTNWGYDPAKAAAERAVGGINTYMNPYTQQVIDTSMADIGAAQQMAMNQLGAQATQAGAFGGSRHGVAEALTNAGFIKQAADTASNLRQQGFQTALGASQQDVANQLQASLANQSAANAASQFGQQLGLQSQTTNAAAANAAAQFGRQLGLQAQTTNAANALQASLANQAARNAASQFGQQLGVQSQTTNAANALAASQANQAAWNNAQQFGQQQSLAAQQANQQAGLSGAQLRLGAANQLGGLSQTGFQQGMDITNQQMQQGLMQQQMNQQLIDAAKAQYAGFTGAPAQSLGLPLAALGASNMGQQTTTATKQPGLFDYLTLAATAAKSDKRLKTNIRRIGKISGVDLVEWDWNEAGKKVADPKQPTVGVIADELAKVRPELVSRGADGYLQVDYGRLFSEVA